ncbi:MAG: winged helix-turn-helix domain-containing protein [Verrucomicrobiales bacterium]|nr:winged helix-turn-helix domain-containing protein [Verrucomicrobiales bacterium]
MSLKAAVTQVTEDKALTKAEILAAIKKLGYKFTAKDPVNSLNTVLYSKKAFKNQGGKFSPA